MNLECYEVKGLPVAVIRDYYTPHQLNNIWKELEFLTCEFKLMPPEESGVGISDETNQYNKNGSGLFLFEFYQNKYLNFSPILRYSRKIFHEEYSNKLIEKNYFFNYIKTSNRDTCLLNYYENKGYYLPHNDIAIITAVSYVYKEPKKFSGGNIIFENELEFACDNNTMILFPSILNHEVTKIECDAEEDGWGRYSIVNFMTIVY